MAHEHDIQDSDKRFVIIPSTRTFTNESGKITLIQGDHNSERFTFEISRYIDGHDMANCNTIKIHYLNATEPGVYEVNDVRVDPNDNDLVIFTWLISGNATKLSGPLNFAIKFACVNDGVVEYAWNTGVFSGLTVGTSLDNGETITQEYADILEQWKSEILADLDTRIETAVDARVGTVIDAANEAAVSAQTNAALAAEAAISAKSYTNVLKSEQTGEIVHVEDSFPGDILETTVYGRSEQVATTGVQLLRSTDAEFTASGATVTIDNGVIHINGTVNGSISASVTGWTDNLKFTIKEKGIYIVSPNASGVVPNLGYYSEGSSSIQIDWTKEIEAGEYTFGIYIPAGTYNNATIKPMINSGTEALSWEPYSGGTPSPSPDYPQDISSITSVDLVTTGANLLDMSIYPLTAGTKSGVTLVINDDGSLNVSGTNNSSTWVTFPSNDGNYVFDSPIMPAGTYILPGYLTVTCKDVNGVTIGNFINKFTIDVDFRIASVYIPIASGNSINTTIYPKLEFENVPTDYSPGMVVSQTIDLQGNELRSLPDGIADELVIAADGSYGIIKRIGTDVLTSSNYLGTLSTGKSYITANTNVFDSAQSFNDCGGNTAVRCDRYPHNNPSVGEKFDKYCYRTWNAVVIVDDRFTTLEEANAILAEEQPYVECIAPVEYIPLGTLETPLALPEDISNVWAVTNLGTTVKVKYVQDVNQRLRNIEVGDVDLSEYALKTEVPTNISTLKNDSGYLTESDLTTETWTFELEDGTTVTKQVMAG